MISPSFPKKMIGLKPAGAPVRIDNRLLRCANNIYLMQEQAGSIRATSFTGGTNIATTSGAPRFSSGSVGGQGIYFNGSTDHLYNDGASGPTSPPFWIASVFTPYYVPTGSDPFPIPYSVASAGTPYGALMAIRISSSGQGYCFVRYLDGGADVAEWYSGQVVVNVTTTIAVISRGTNNHCVYQDGVAYRNTTNLMTGSQLRQRGVGGLRRGSSSGNYFNGVVHFAADGQLDPGEQFFIDFTADPWSMIYARPKYYSIYMPQSTAYNRRRRVICLGGCT